MLQHLFSTDQQKMPASVEEIDTLEEFLLFDDSDTNAAN